MGLFDKLGKAAEGLQAGATDAGGASAGAELRAPASRATCPACGKASVHVAPPGCLRWNTGDDVVGIGSELFLRTSNVVMASPTSALICSACGWFEFYLQDPAQLAAVAASWPRVEGGLACGWHSDARWHSPCWQLRPRGRRWAAPST